MTSKDEGKRATGSGGVDTGGGTYVDGDVHVHGGDFVGRDQGSAGGQPPVDLDSEAADAARERYRLVLRQHYNVIETHAFTALAADDQAGSPKRPPLLGEGGVYVPLIFDTPRLEHGEKRRTLPDGTQVRTAWEFDSGTLPEVLKLFPAHLAIVGDAGSGKTTVLHVICSALTADDPEAAFGARFDVLDGERPLPVLLPLRLFEHACASNESESYTRCPDDLLRFVDDWFSRWCPIAELPPGFLAAHIRTGRAWFLLDALDEVADSTHRLTVRNIIRDLADQLSGTRLIATARVAAYRNARLDPPFTVVRVRDLDDEQRSEMVHNIYGGLALADAERRADELAGLFGRSEQLQDLTRTPVMVWTAAVIHALRGELPESRAALYDAYVDILLKHSFKRTRYDAGAVKTLVEGEGWPLPDRRHYRMPPLRRTESWRRSQHGARRRRAAVMSSWGRTNSSTGCSGPTSAKTW